MSLYLTPIILFAAPCSRCKTFYLLQVVLLLFLFIFSCICLCSNLSRREWGFHVVHTILKCKSVLCTYLGEFPLDFENTFSDPLIGYFFCRSIFQVDFLLQYLDPQYSLISLHLFVIGYVHLISLILWEMHTLWGSSYYIGLLNFCSHFGNRCQWGRSLEGLREFDFML